MEIDRRRGSTMGWNPLDLKEHSSVHIRIFKDQLFWEGHKKVRNSLYGFEIYLVNIKTIRKILQIFVAFSEKLNFNIF